MIHLTNDAVQKKSEDYGKFEQANKMSYPELQKYFDNNFPDKKLDVQGEIVPRMKEIATDTIKAVYSKVDPAK